MKTLTYVFAFLIALNLIVSCGKSNAKAKINKNNLEVAKTRDVDIKKGAALITFENKEFDFGTVDEGEIVETVFKVTNSGKTDLIIIDALTSCGCTVPVWPKKPIKPGETKDIEVRFNTNGKKNRQQKIITLLTNTESGREVLTLKGMVTPKEK